MLLVFSARYIGDCQYIQREKERVSERERKVRCGLFCPLFLLGGGGGNVDIQLFHLGVLEKAYRVCG